MHLLSSDTPTTFPLNDRWARTLPDLSRSHTSGASINSGTAEGPRCCGLEPDVESATNVPSGAIAILAFHSTSDQTVLPVESTIETSPPCGPCIGAVSVANTERLSLAARFLALDCQSHSPLKSSTPVANQPFISSRLLSAVNAASICGTENGPSRCWRTPFFPRTHTCPPSKPTARSFPSGLIARELTLVPLG